MKNAAVLNMLKGAVTGGFFTKWLVMLGFLFLMFLIYKNTY